MLHKTRSDKQTSERSVSIHHVGTILCPVIVSVRDDINLIASK